jgi:hypothetical protein
MNRGSGPVEWLAWALLMGYRSERIELEGYGKSYKT